MVPNVNQKLYERLDCEREVRHVKWAKNSCARPSDAATVSKRSWSRNGTAGDSERLCTWMSDKRSAPDVNIQR